ncbi:trypsin-like serine peptidase [Streptomyces sp. NPDC127084]|uniref:trypsin-like serine peptidase n=1 Tax=Streptomyces sp. NPDC127084 TaxID=3347133 RepID=UPI00365292A2
MGTGHAKHGRHSASASGKKSRLRISVAAGVAIAVLGGGSALACIDRGQDSRKPVAQSGQSKKSPTPTPNSTTTPRPGTKGNANGDGSGKGNGQGRPSSTTQPRPASSPKASERGAAGGASLSSPGRAKAAALVANGGNRGVPDATEQAIGYLAVDFDYKGTDFLPSYTQCSATVVSRNVIATAAHCVVKAGEHAGSREAFFAPALNSGKQPEFKDYYRSSRIFVHPEYDAGKSSWERTAYDVAFVVLDPRNGRSIGDAVGWVPSRSENSLTGSRLKIAGYPSESVGRYRLDVCQKQTRALPANRGKDPDSSVIWGVSTCPNLGDGASGGPWFADQGGGDWVMVGVNHGTFRHNGQNAAAAATLGDDAWRTFQTAKRFAGDQG